MNFPLCGKSAKIAEFGVKRGKRHYNENLKINTIIANLFHCFCHLLSLFHIKITILWFFSAADMRVRSLNQCKRCAAAHHSVQMRAVYITVSIIIRVPDNSPSKNSPSRQLALQKNSPSRQLAPKQLGAKC